MRLITLDDARAAHLAALDWLFLEQERAGTLQPTAVHVRWTGLSFALGPNEDGDQLDHEAVRAAGLTSSRRMGVGGGTAVYEPGLSQYVLYYPRERLRADGLLERVDAEGEAIATALRDAGVPAGYRSIGDVEIDPEGERRKVGGNGATNLSAGLGSSSAGLIWAPLSSEALGLLGSVVRQPKEKFEDKAVKTFAGRMTALAEETQAVGADDVTQGDLMRACIAAASRALLDEEVHDEEWTERELTGIGEALEFFEAPIWHYKYSTKALAARARPGAVVGAAAFKARKLVKASVVLDPDGVITDALITTDAFCSPVATPARSGLCEALSAALRGCLASDAEVVANAVGAVLARPDVDMPLVGAEDIARAVARAVDVSTSREEHLAG